MHPRWRIVVPVAALILVGLVLLAVLWPNGPTEHLVIGLVLGTMFGQTTAAAAWNAFGPAHLAWRLPLSLGWITTLVAAFGINIALHQRPDPDFVVLLAFCMLGQWAALQFLLGGLAIGYGLRLRHPDDGGQILGPRARQFGIRQLMIITAIVGVTLGIGRAIVSNVSATSLDNDFAIIVFLGVAAIVMTLPLLIAALLPRLAIPAVIVVATLIGLATAWELPLLTKYVAGPGPDAIHLIWINTFTCAWVLAFVTAARLSGYGLAVPASPAADPSGSTE